MFHEKYDKVLSDYYKYIVNLMAKQLAKIDLKGVLLIDIDRPVLSSIFPPFFKIKLQIEHTLAKTGARDSEGAVIGGIIVHESERPAPPPYRDDVVYVNGVPYRYATQCDPDYISQDRHGNDVVVRGQCRRTLVPLT